MIYWSGTDDGAIEYKVIRPMEKGDVASISYITTHWEMPTHKRREELWEHWAFICECPRCTGPDFSRHIRCTECTNRDSFIPCVYDSKREPTWTCQHCGTLGDSRKEQELLSRLTYIENDLYVTDSLEPLQKLAYEASMSLSPTHYITIQALQTVSDFSAAKARLQE